MGEGEQQMGRLEAGLQQATQLLTELRKEQRQALTANVSQDQRLVTLESALTRRASLERMEQMERAVKTLQHVVESTETSTPGLAVRMGSVEKDLAELVKIKKKVVAWAIGAGLAGLSAGAGGSELIRGFFAP